MLVRDGPAAVSGEDQMGKVGNDIVSIEPRARPTEKGRPAIRGGGLRGPISKETGMYFKTRRAVSVLAVLALSLFATDYGFEGASGAFPGIFSCH